MIHQAQEKGRADAFGRAGIPYTPTLSTSRIKEELKHRQLRSTMRRGETVEDLKQRLLKAVDDEIASGKVTVPADPGGEFDWVVLKSGGLHWERKLLQTTIEVLWPFVYKAFIDSQGYTTERQQEWARTAKNHHRSMDEMSRFIDGVYDELLRPYVLAVENPTPAGFFEWCEQFADNLTFSWLLELTTTCCFSLIVYRHGIRHNQ